jgi:hypothetical protein
MTNGDGAPAVVARDDASQPVPTLGARAPAHPIEGPSSRVEQGS